jgi:LPS-assembly protein
VRRLRPKIWITALLGLLLALVPAPRPVPAQGVPASLVADRVTYDREARLLTAEGGVEVFYEGRVLRARRIVYDEGADEIRASGPIVLTGPEGEVVLAEAAELDPDLTEGLIRGARLLVAGKLQLAATEVRRTAGRFTTLFQTVASSCEICAENPVPTWAIRAARVTEDARERQIYFENATLEIFGLPVAWLPYFRIPDPRLERASGFLVPEFSSSDIYGFGLRVPYYRVLGPHADATFAPFVTTGGARILETEYRQRFRRGALDISGAFALDDGLGGSERGFLTAEGVFALGRGFFAGLDVSATTDDSFLRQFDYSDVDRLTSSAGIHRTRLTDHFELNAVAFQSLRPEEATGRVPYVLPEFTYRRLYRERVAGGRIGVEARALGLWRDIDRDLARAGFGLDWRRDAILPRGVLAAAFAAADADFYRIRNDGDFDDGETRTNVTRTLGVGLRWPLARTGPRAIHVIEPVVQLLHTANSGQESVPNEDSQLPEFDETNLFALNRFPGVDRVETGLRANLGVNYLRQDPDGWSLGATVGRVLRAEPGEALLEGAGLAGRGSDWVTAVSLEVRDTLRISNHALFDGALDFRRNELEFALMAERGAVRASYVMLAEDASNPLLGPVPETSEIMIDARYRFAPNWRFRAGWRYDLANDSNIRARGGLTYGNECAEIDLSLSRRFTASDNVPPSTSVGFIVRLTGLGASGSEDWPSRGCRG